MIKFNSLLVAGAVSIAVVTSGCASLGTMRDRPLTSGEKIAGCVAQIVIFELIGREVGLKKGGGGAIGAATCAAWLYFNNEQDKKRIAEVERRALDAEQPQEAAWTGEDNAEKTVRVSFADSPPADALASGNYCRTMNTEVSVAGQQGSNSVVMCRVQGADGSVRWIPQDSVGV